MTNLRAAITYGICKLPDGFTAEGDELRHIVDEILALFTDQQEKSIEELISKLPKQKIQPEKPAIQYNNDALEGFNEAIDQVKTLLTEYRSTK